MQTLDNTLFRQLPHPMRRLNGALPVGAFSRTSWGNAFRTREAQFPNSRSYGKSVGHRLKGDCCSHRFGRGILPVSIPVIAPGIRPPRA